MPTNLEKAEAERESHKSTIAVLSKIVDTIAGEVEADLYLLEAQTVKQKLGEAHEKILACVPADMSTHQPEYETLLLEVIKLIRELKLKKAGFTVTTTTTPHSSGPSQVRLPRIELPHFNGTLSDWMAFKDLYTAAIHNNASLVGAQKLTYLKSCLVGEAAKLLKAIPCTDDNYEGAWKQLAERFQNKRELFFAVLKRFTRQAQIQPDSAAGIRNIIDVSKECIRSIENLGVSVGEWDGILVFLIMEKLDSASRQFWELSLADTEIPKLKEFLDFLEARARGLTAGGSSSSQKPKNVDPGKRTAFAHHTNGAPTKIKCKVCTNSEHPIFKCSRFLAMAVEDRSEAVKKLALCFNCLESGHLSRNCPCEKNCRKCSGRHHTLLHLPKSGSGGESSVALGHHSHGEEGQFTTSILATAIVKLTDKAGQLHSCRALLDGGSTSSFISETCVRRLGLRRGRNAVDVVGLGSTAVGTARGSVSISFYPHFDNEKKNVHTVTALILPKVTGKLPVYRTNPQSWKHLASLQLADPSYHEPAEVDVLLGADIFYELLRDGRRRGESGTPVGLRSTLGWLVAGSISPPVVTQVRTHFADTDLDRTLQQFWELESVPTTRVLTKEEEICENHFAATTTRNADGRFVVEFPFKEAGVSLGPSRDIAVRRLTQLERRLAKNPAQNVEYRKFMLEYESLGHMTKMTQEETQSTSRPAYYIPHHLIVKESSTSTKFRVVFDASAKTATGASLNDNLYVGPTLQDSLISILMRFRTHVVAFTADIAKMYRQVLIKPEHTYYQRILWRDSPKDPIQDYRLLTVTYGTASGPYHATKVLQALAEAEKEDLPLAATVASQDHYMDDCMSGAPNIEAALKTQTQLRELMRRGGFDIRKWSSNRSELLESLPEELRETQLPLRIDLDETIKTLGLHWNPGTDDFSFKVNLTISTLPMTKRTLLSEMSKVFDPIGWLAPVIIRAKIVFQQLWKLDVGWDDPLPAYVQEEWNTYRGNLHLIEKVRIRRCCVPANTQRVELFCFCDASEKAFAAVIYVRACLPNGKYQVSLCTSKTRVAPTKQITLPRLELCGAVVLVQLVSAVQKALKIKIDAIHAYTDSTAVLAWINAQPQRWKTFVANRVAEIQQVVPPSQWSHVSGFENPADCASRGIDPAELYSHPLWWTGPVWMNTEKTTSPSASSDSPIPQSVSEEERRVVLVSHTQVIPSSSLIFRYSSLTRLKRITAWCRRFIQKCSVAVKKKRDPSNSAPISQSEEELSPAELSLALLFWVRIVQNAEFNVEISHLEQQREIPSKSKIRSLNPFLDSTQLLRVGGRLRHAPISRDQRTPILLPRHHRLTELIIQNEHELTFHGGAQLILANLHRQFWIVGARDAIRHQVKKCTTCTRHAARVGDQFMGDLPAVRVTPARPFLKTGVDYAGPFTLRPIPARSKVTFKAYLALFVCMTTRAIHLEVVSSLTTEAFLQAFRRFVGRRGLCTDMYSDCGTNFVGAAAELKDLFSLVNSQAHQQQVKSLLANEGVHWQFNPPSAPHFGGLWEAGVKSVKHHLFRTIGLARLTFEELSTVVIQIEACLNSRPLTPVSTDPTDLCALTPGHFLIGGALKAVPEADFTDTNVNRLTRWQMVQQLHQQFWKRWSGEFLTRLQQRPKWLKCRTDIRVDDLVLIKDDNLPPLRWKLGRVIVCHPGADNMVRVVTVKTADGELKRPIVKLCLLPHDPATKLDNYQNDNL